MAKLPSLGADFDPDVLRLIRYVTIARKSDFWSDEVVESARQTLVAEYGRVPAFEDLAARFGEDLVVKVVRDMVKSRLAQLRQWQEQMGEDSPCHICECERGAGDPHYDFGLAANVKTKRNWAGAVGVLALNALTLPLGVAVGARPGTTTTANIARCRLVLCARCARDREGFWGGLKVSEEDCQQHPSWSRLVAEGYTRFLNQETLAQYTPQR